MAEASAAGSADPKIARNLALINGLAGPTAPPVAQMPVAQAPVAQTKPATGAQAATELTAKGPPTPLGAAATPLETAKNESRASPNTIFMQQVPYDPLAGPVAKRPAKPTPRKLAHAPHRTTAEVVRSTIPALRLANDRQ